MDNPPYARPPTPQALLHRAPNKPDVAADASPTKPTKYITLLLAPTSVAGKVQIATSVSHSLSCPLFQGDSLHETSAKAAAVGASRTADAGRARYQRMWLSKLTRTGLLFPSESRPATEGFSGFGGASSSPSSSSSSSSYSTSTTSRRGSASSVSSAASSSAAGGASAASSAAAAAAANDDNDDGGKQSVGADSGPYIHKTVTAFEISDEARRLRRANPALMVLTHPQLQPWHRDAIREAVGEYGIGVIFVPLFRTDAGRDDELEDGGADEVPVLRPLNPRTISGFSTFDAFRVATAGGGVGGGLLKYGKGKGGNLEEEMVLEVDVGGSVEEITGEVVRGVRDVMIA